jgi:hypothetical protein
MGDWNTLHFFDDKKFYSEVVVDLKDKGILLQEHFNSKFEKYAFGNDNSKKRINDIIDFCRLLDKDFKSHKVLYEIATRKKNLTEEYSAYNSTKVQDENKFINDNAQIIEDLNRTLTLIIFSECASFNPHLILGRRIFSDCVKAKPKTISEDIIANIICSPTGSIHNGFGNGLINWITNEELQLLWLDKENLDATCEDAKNYFMEFINFMEIAIDNGLGLISGTNMNESLLKKIEAPKLTIKIELTEMGFKNIVKYE